MNGYLDSLQTLNADATIWVQVTVVKTLGSVPPETGSKMLVTENGLFWGTVGGGKLEKKALDVALEMLDSKQDGTSDLAASAGCGHDLRRQCHVVF